MNTFIEKVEENLAQFTPFEAEQAAVFGNYFAKNEANVSFFIDEIRHTAAILSPQNDVAYAEIYAKKLLEQVDALQKAVKSIQKKSKLAAFSSNYRFPKNVHALPVEKRLIEYRKALRILNDKISWLLDKQYHAQNDAERIHYQQQIQETEFRRKKCLAAIEILEEH